MKIRKIVFYFLFTAISGSVEATNYYINSADGNDYNNGKSKTFSWKTISPLSDIQLQSGDSILFATGQQFTGMLSLINIKGQEKHPVVISSYSYKGNKAKPILDAGQDLNTILIQNSSFIKLESIEITASIPYQKSSGQKKERMRCGVLVEVTKDESFGNIILNDIIVHDVYYNISGFTRSAEETKSANGTQNYGWGIRFINNTKSGYLTNIQVLNTNISRVSHTGLKFTATTGAIKKVTVTNCTIQQTGGPGMQLSGVTDGHIHHNKIDHSGSMADTRNWGRGSGMWTWGCKNILIEYNRFENANGPGDSAGVHIDFNCSDVVVQYNISVNNAGGFCEILGNNYNCAYRYNISINDGFREKGINGAFQEGKIFWLSGYQGNEKKRVGPFNSYFYNNTIYVAANIIPKIAVSSSANGIYITNNIFYFERAAKMVAGDQKKQEIEMDSVSNIVFKNNLYLRADNWPADLSLQDAAPVMGDPMFKNKGGNQISDYLPANKKLIQHKGLTVLPIPNDSVGIRIGLQVAYDILGNPIIGQPDLGAIKINY